VKPHGGACHWGYVGRLIGLENVVCKVKNRWCLSCTWATCGTTYAVAVVLAMLLVADCEVRAVSLKGDTWGVRRGQCA
jgi:hypothetical protein